MLLTGQSDGSQKLLLNEQNPKPQLATCGAEKLHATVQVTRLECKQLQDRLKHLQAKKQTSLI